MKSSFLKCIIFKFIIILKIFSLVLLQKISFKSLCMGYLHPIQVLGKYFKSIIPVFRYWQKVNKHKYYNKDLIHDTCCGTFKKLHESISLWSSTLNQIPALTYVTISRHSSLSKIYPVAMWTHTKGQWWRIPVCEKLKFQQRNMLYILGLCDAPERGQYTWHTLAYLYHSHGEVGGQILQGLSALCHRQHSWHVHSMHHTQEGRSM